ncbi:MAG: PadR family transcriptional regulator [Psychrosphaera sp.]|nr:PadR family transcriptional regulator [Psychrosphaera sp.]
MDDPQQHDGLSSQNEIDEQVAAQVKKLRKELSSGTVALALLSILSKAKEPLYGYQIAKQFERPGLNAKSSEKQGSLYPVLRNMSAKGLLDSETVPSLSGPPRRYYTISALGRLVLAQWLEIWQQTQTLVNNIIGMNDELGDEDKIGGCNE